MTVFFTSDTHFGHEKIIVYSRRPFASAAEMDEALIAAWNDRVGHEDEVYHLGDMTLKSRGFARRIFARLNGRIRVLGLPWHHDRGWVPKTLGPSTMVSASGHPVEILPPLVVIRAGEGPGGVLTLSHYPMAEWEGSHYGTWHLHGHSHGEHHGAGAKLDVGVDVHDYKPVALHELAALMPEASPRDTRL